MEAPLVQRWKKAVAHLTQMCLRGLIKVFVDAAGNGGPDCTGATGEGRVSSNTSPTEGLVGRTSSLCPRSRNPVNSTLRYHWTRDTEGRSAPHLQGCSQRSSTSTSVAGNLPRLGIRCIEQKHRSSCQGRQGYELMRTVASGRLTRLRTRGYVCTPEA